MLHRLTTYLLLACYSAIVLSGQGLHWWLGDDSCCSAEVSQSGKVAEADVCQATCHHRHACNHAHGHSHLRATAVKSEQVAVKSEQVAARSAKAKRSVDGDRSAAGDQLAVRSHQSGSQHDCEHCAICQHQSLGQLFVDGGVEICGLLGCDEFRSTYSLPLATAAPHSLSQPRAPPAA